MAKISKAVRRALAEAQNWRCAYCAVVLEPNGPTMATVDHVVPQGVGGATVRENLVSACAACNCARGADIDVWTFWKVRRRLRDSGIWPQGEAPCREIAEFLRAHRAYTRAKVALRRRGQRAQPTASQMLVQDLVEALNDGCTLTALQITRLGVRERRCGGSFALSGRLEAESAGREEWDCLWAGVADRAPQPRFARAAVCRSDDYWPPISEPAGLEA